MNLPPYPGVVAPAAAVAETAGSSSGAKVAIARAAQSRRFTPRPPRKNSRMGCFTCKRKRLKCDECRPLCKNCLRTGLECGGYPSAPTRNAPRSRRGSSAKSPPEVAVAGPQDAPEPAEPSDESSRQLIQTCDAEPEPETPLPLVFSQPLHNILDTFISVYANYTAPLLAILGMNTNPWVRLVLPAARQSSYLAYALCGMAAHHIGYKREGIEFTARSFRGVQHALATGQRSDDMTAAIVCLGWIEVWDFKTTCGVEHIRACKKLIQLRPNAGATEIARFMRSMWIYQNSLSSLSATNPTLDRPIELDAFNHADEPRAASTVTTTRLGIDPILGTAEWLFLRIPHMVYRIFCYLQDPQASNLDQLLRLYDEVMIWRSEKPHAGLSEEEASEVVATAECYRLALLLFLYTHIPSFVPDECSDMPYRLSQSILSYLRTISVASRLLTVQLWPLVEAATYARGDKDRMFVRHRFAAVERRLRFGNMMKGYELVQEVWARLDENPSLTVHDVGGWRAVMLERNWNVFMG